MSPARLLWLCPLVVGACAGDAIVLTVDAVAADDYDTVEVALVASGDGTATCGQLLQLSPDALPQSLAVLAGERIARSAAVRVRGLREGVLLDQRVTEIAFATDETIERTLRLDDSCRGTPCGPTEDCVQGECGSPIEGTFDVLGPTGTAEACGVWNAP